MLYFFSLSYSLNNCKSHCRSDKERERPSQKNFLETFQKSRKEQKEVVRKMKVELLVYDLSHGLAKILSPALLGKEIEAVYHTSVRVNKIEYYFGSGIIVQNDGIFASKHGLQPYLTLSMGETEVTTDDITSYLESIQDVFNDKSYDLFTNNCNNFSDELCKFLTGNGIPQYILDLPNEALKTPAGSNQFI